MKMSQLTIKQILERVDIAMLLLGWKGGNKFSTWIDDDTLILCIEKKYRFTIPRKNFRILKNLFHAQRIKVYETNLVCMEENLLPPKTKLRFKQ